MRGLGPEAQGVALPFPFPEGHATPQLGHCAAELGSESGGQGSTSVIQVAA